MRGSLGRCAAVILTAVLGSACNTPGPAMGFVFSAAIEDPSIKVPHVLWLERIDIEQPVLHEQELLETVFTYNFARVLRQKKIFKAVKIETGAAAPDDWIVRVRVQRLMQRGKVPLLSYLI